MSPIERKGQDRLLVTPRFIGVADGATPLDPSWPANVGDFAADALHELATASANEARDIRAVWRQAITTTAAKFSVKEPELSCGVAMARPVRDSIEIATLGDCGVIVRCTDNSLVSLRDTRLSVLDEEAASAIGPEMQRRLAYNRASMNTPAGYWVFAAHPGAADHICTKQIPMSEVVDLLLFSDGFYRLRDPYGIISGDGALVTMVRKLGPAQAIQQLRDYEYANNNIDKIGDPLAPDDATLVLAMRPE